MFSIINIFKNSFALTFNLRHLGRWKQTIATCEKERQRIIDFNIKCAQEYGV